MHACYFVCISTMSPSSKGNVKPTFCGLKGKRLFDVGVLFTPLRFSDGLAHTFA